MNLSTWAFKNKNLIYFLIAVLLAGGLYSAYDMSKLEDPEIQVKRALIATTYPGASAHQVELEVTDPLEKSIRSMGSLEHVQSYSFNDLSIIQVDLLSTVGAEEIEQKWDLLRRKVSATTLPSSAYAPIIKDDFGDVYGMFFALTADGGDNDDLNRYAEFIKREIQDIEGVSRVELYGKHQECINITLLESKMANMGVKAYEVLATLNGQNATTYSGYFMNGDNRVRVAVTDRFTNVEDIASMLIEGHEDDQIILKDIANIEKAEVDPVRNYMTYNGEQAIGILISAISGTDITKIGAKVMDRLEEIQQNRLPAGVVCHKVFYQPERVNDALSTFLLNLAESIFIVVVILMIFMGFRSGLIIGVSLLVIVVGSFLFLGALDGTMQRVSLGSFILAMGMLVDNAIVVVDGILVDLKAGKNRRKAMTDIGARVAMPLLGATLIAILAFLPIFLSPDTTGLYVRDLFIVLGVSLMLSWVLAMFHVPLMANRILKVNSSEGEQEQFKGPFYTILDKMLTFGLNHRISFVAIMVILLVLSIMGYGSMKQGFFPDMNYDQLYMEYKLPENSDVKQVEKDLLEIQEYLRSRDEVTNITASIGGTPGRYNLVRSIATPSLSYGELIIDFKSPKLLVSNMEEIQEELTRRYPQAYVKLKRYNLMYKKYPIEAVVTGPDPDVLHSLSEQITAIAKEMPEMASITTDWEPKVPLLNVEYDQMAARALGLSRSDVSTSLLAITSGIPVGTFYEGIDQRTIYIKSTAQDGSKFENLENAQVFSSLPTVNQLINEELLVKLRAGSLTKSDVVESLMGNTPLASVAKDISITWEDPVVPRLDGSRAQSVQMSPAFGYETERSRAKLEAAISERIQMPEGYSLTWQGEKAASDASTKYLFGNYPMAVILMIAIMIMLFKDYRKPAIILCTLPMVLVGVIATMLLTGKTFGFVAIVGVLGLIGMLIKNGIVLMDEITLEIESGIEPYEALKQSAKSRLRAVAMAALTTVLGMIPLLPDAMFGSMAAAIMGGLTFGTIIILVFLPVLYSLFFNIKKEKQ